MTEIKINIVELASELAARDLEEYWSGSMKIWDEQEYEIKYTEEAQDIFNDLYDKYYSLIESTKI